MSSANDSPILPLVDDSVNHPRRLSTLFTHSNREDILERVLDLLPWPDLVACSLVCGNTSRLIASSSRLQLYLREVYHSSPLSTTSSNPLRTQVNNLIAREHNVFDLHPCQLRTVSRKNAQSVQTSGHFLLVGESNSDTPKSTSALDVPQGEVPPSWDRVVDGWSVWYLPEADCRMTHPRPLSWVDFGEPILATAMSEKDDLLVVATKLPVQHISGLPSTYRLYLFTLRPISTPQIGFNPDVQRPPTHSQASFPFIDLVVSEMLPMTVHLELGPQNRLLVALNIEMFEHAAMVGVWNWQTGLPLGRVPDIDCMPSRYSYAMISSQYIVCAVQEPAAHRQPQSTTPYPSRRRRTSSGLRCGLVVYAVKNQFPAHVVPPKDHCVWFTSMIPFMLRQTTFDLPLFGASPDLNGIDHFIPRFHVLSTGRLQVSPPADSEYPGGVFAFDLAGTTLQSVYVQDGQVSRRATRSTGSRGGFYLPSMLRLIDSWKGRVIPFKIWRMFATFEPIDLPCRFMSTYGTKKLIIGGDKTYRQLIDELRIDPKELAVKMVDYNPVATQRRYTAGMSKRSCAPLGGATRGESHIHACERNERHAKQTVSKLRRHVHAKPRMVIVKRELVDSEARVTRYRRDRLRCLGELASLEISGRLYIDSTRDLREVVFDGKRIVLRSYGRIDILEF